MEVVREENMSHKGSGRQMKQWGGGSDRQNSGAEGGTNGAKGATKKGGGVERKRRREGVSWERK